MSLGALEGDQSLKMPSYSISESIIFQNFLGGMPPEPLVLACFACQCALHTMTVHIPAIPMITNLVVPPFQMSRSAPDNVYFKYIAIIHLFHQCSYILQHPFHLHPFQFHQHLQNQLIDFTHTAYSYIVIQIVNSYVYLHPLYELQ